MNAFKQTQAQEIKEKVDDEAATILDIRKKAVFAAGHIPSAIHAPRQQLDAFTRQLAKDKPLIIYCYKGIGSQAAAQFFVDAGFTDVHSLTGGFDAWQISFPESIES